MRNPERDPWPSVADHPEEDACPFCEADPDQKHQPSCPLYVPCADDLMQCDTCGVEFYSACLCDHDCEE